MFACYRLVLSVRSADRTRALQTEAVAAGVFSSFWEGFLQGLERVLQWGSPPARSLRTKWTILSKT